MTETTSASRVAQRDDTPASHAKAPAVARAALRPALPPQLLAAFGAADDDFIKGLFHQLTSITFQNGTVDNDDFDFMCSVIKGIKPRDQLETMLAAQMAAVHVATMTSAQRLRHADTIPKRDSAERAFNKLARTFATQMEALMRYRSGGEQKVVQHVSVSDGGQAAIVGNVTQAPRGSAANGPASRT